MRLAALTVTAALLLTGCGGDTPAPAAAPRSPSAIARALGCEPKVDGAPTMFAREEATCGASDDSTWRNIATFADNTNRDQWVEVAGSFGGIIVVGERWAVLVNDQASAETVAAKLGGKVSN